MILAFDTTAKVSSVSLVSEQKVLAEYSVNLNFTHSQTLMPMCESLLRCCGIGLQEIDLFAAANGPGSFTGLRIGIAAVKGLAFACQKDCVAVSTLDALCQNVSGFEGIICSVMDARCNQVYHALYRSHADGTAEKITEDCAITIEALLKELTALHQPVMLVGDGADLCYSSYKDSLPGCVIAGSSHRYQSASSVGILAVRKAQCGQTVSAASLSPEYLRLPQAQRELIKKSKEKKA